MERKTFCSLFAFIKHLFNKHECTLRLKDQSEWVLSELTSSFALTKLLHPTPCALALSRAIYIMVRDFTWQEYVSHCERLALTPFLW